MNDPRVRLAQAVIEAVEQMQNDIEGLAALADALITTGEQLRAGEVDEVLMSLYCIVATHGGVDQDIPQ